MVVQPCMNEFFMNRPECQNFVARARIQRWGGRGSGPPPPPEKSQNNIGFLRNTGPDPLKITKLQSQHSMLGYHWPVPVSEMPFNGLFTGGPMMARFKCFLDSLSPHQKKKRCQSWTPSGKIFWIRAWLLE